MPIWGVGGAVALLSDSPKKDGAPRKKRQPKQQSEDQSEAEPQPEEKADPVNIEKEARRLFALWYKWAEQNKETRFPEMVKLAIFVGANWGRKIIQYPDPPAREVRSVFSQTQTRLGMAKY